MKFYQIHQDFTELYHECINRLASAEGDELRALHQRIAELREEATPQDIEMGKHLDDLGVSIEF